MGRQEKPIQVFHDRLKNHELVGERWPDEWMIYIDWDLQVQAVHI